MGMRRIRIRDWIDQRLATMGEPVSVRNALSVVVGSTTMVVLGSGVLMWLVDHKEYPNIGRGLWWSLQTVTTVGYGDVTPAKVSGRLVGLVVMLWGVAFISIFVAGVTSTFVSRADRARREEEAADDAGVAHRLDDLASRMERIEQALTKLDRS
jgi:voltage-gated potassium channel